VTDWAALLLALLVVVITTAPFLTALVLFARGRRRAHLDADLARLLGSHRAHGQDST